MIWAVLCHIALAVPAQDCVRITESKAERPDGDMLHDAVCPEDTLPATKDVELKEVTIKARPVWRKDDCKLVFPTAEQVKQSTDGMDLLRLLYLPRVSVNPLTGGVGATSGGEICLCINGVRVTSAELAAVPPADILQIRYYDSPGARYGDAELVIDYITKRREKGGSVNGDFFNGVGTKGASAIDALSVRHSAGRSEWVWGAQCFQVKRDDWIRDYEETRVFPVGNVYRKEVGSPVPVNLKSLGTYLNYSYMRSGNLFLNVRMNYTADDTPNSEEGDRRNLLYTSDTDAPLAVYEHMTERSHTPVLDLYAQYTLRDGGKLIFNTVGTYIRTSVGRLYQEEREGETVTEVLSTIRGNKYSLIAEAVYEKRLGTHVVTGGVRHMQAYMNNRYAGTDAANVVLRQAESSFYGEYSRHIGRWGYMGNLTGTRLYYSQKGMRSERFALLPSARLSFEPDERTVLKYRIDMRTAAPSLSAMNDAEQAVDAGMVRRGNAGLKSFRTLDQTFSAGYDGRWLSADLTVGYKHEFNPVMETVRYEDGLFVRTYENRPSFCHLRAEVALVCRPWKNHVMLSVTPELNRYFTRDCYALHTRTVARLRWDVELAYGCWTLRYNTLVGYANYVYGDLQMKEKNMHTVMLGYKRPKWALQCGLLNPFLKEYWMETQDGAVCAPSVSRAHSDHPLQFLVKLNLNLNYGRQVKKEQKQLHNEDTDAGIMQGTK